MIATLIIALMLFELVFANIYVTNPVASTTYTPGQLATLQWTDDSTQPSLSKLGNVTVELLCQNNHLVVTFAKGFNPAALSLKVHIPPNLSSTSDYYIRFTPPPPNAAIYTSRFQIRSPSSTINTNSTLNKNNKNSTYAFINSASLLPSNIVSKLPNFSPIIPSAIVGPLTFHPLPLFHATPTSEIASSSASSTSSSRPQNAKQSRAFRGNERNGWFNLGIFLVWPSLLGVVIVS